MNKFLSAALSTAGAIFLVTLSQPSLAQAQLSGTEDELRGFLFPRANTVSINGEGELTAYKDLAKVSLQVRTEANSLNQAMLDNQQLRLSLVEEFTAAGIADTDINNSRFSSSPQFGLFGRKPNSFEVTARLEISASNEEHLQLLASAADSHDEVVFEQAQFEHSQQEESEAEVRELALQDVMEQKTYYESSLGLQLRAVNFFHGAIRQRARSMPMAAASQEMTSDLLSARDAAVSSIAPAAAVAPTFDEVEYQTSITVVFEIINEN